MSNRQRWIDFVKKNNPEDTDLYDLLEQAYQMGKTDVVDRKQVDTILCSDKEDAKNAICNIGLEYIDDWEYLPNGKVLIVLNCQLKDIADK